MVALGALLGTGVLSLAKATAAKPATEQVNGTTLPAAPPAGSREAQFWARAKMEQYKSPGELQSQRARDLRKGLQFAILPHGDKRERTVALTFDDGPHPQYTLQLLAILRKYHVKATFFVVGEMAQQYPGLVRAELADGNLVGNHTYHHVNLTKIPDPEVVAEWQACQAVVKRISGQTMRFDRPPGGDYDASVVRAAEQVGLTTVLWTDDPGDYASPGDRKIETRVLDRVGNGGIILLHDGIQQTIDVLPQIIERLQMRGYRFVTVAELQAGRK